MPIAITLVLFAVTTGLIALTPAPEPELLTPEPFTLASLVPGWITRRRARRQVMTMEEEGTVTWLTRVAEADSVSFGFGEMSDGQVVIGTARRGQVVEVNLPATPRRRAVPPWAAAPSPTSKSSSMLPDRPDPLPVPMREILPAPEPEGSLWWMDQPEPEQSPEPRAWQAGDSADPPTIVKGLRVILDEDLGKYLKEAPGYGEK